MGHRTGKCNHRVATKSYTLPSSPTHSSSSSEFEFTVPSSPRKSSADLRPADELFYKGKLLPLHLSPRLSMVRTLLLSSSSSSSSDTTTTASRDSTASSSSSGDLLHHLDLDSSRPSSATDDDLKTLSMHSRKPSKYNFSLPKFSSVFRQKSPTGASQDVPATRKSFISSRSSSAKEVICKYFKKVKPLYEKLSHKVVSVSPPTPPPPPPTTTHEDIHPSIMHSFSGNLRYPRGRSCFSSCPSSIGSSPTHGRTGLGFGPDRTGSGIFNSDASSMEELQSAIQGAILHCKNSMLQNKAMVSNEI